MKSFRLLAVAFFLTACASIPKTNYKDTSHLERPPGSPVANAVAKPTEATDKSAEETGLGATVSIDDQEQPSLLLIDKSFDRAWAIVAKALKLKKVKITDRNRDQGIFDIDYATETSKTSKTVGGFTFPFFSEDHEKNSYKLTLVETDNTTEVTAMLQEPDIDSSVDEDEAEDKEETEDPVDNSSKIILELYLTIRDELPDDF